MKHILAASFLTLSSCDQAFAANIPFFNSNGTLNQSAANGWYVSNGWSDGAWNACWWKFAEIGKDGNNLTLTIQSKKDFTGAVNDIPVGKYACGEIQSWTRQNYGIMYQYKTAFVLSHKIREALSNTTKNEQLNGEIEIDGAYFGGYIKPANHKEHRLDRRTRFVQNGKRECVVVMRQRGGDALTSVFKAEHDSLATIQNRVANGSTIYADDANGWNDLHNRYLTKRINHNEAYSMDGACTNMAESFFSRLRRAEVGTHHHIAGKYLNLYVSEMSWRENNRRVSNGEQYLIVTNAALHAPVSRVWKGYWQKVASRLYYLHIGFLQKISTSS